MTPRVSKLVIQEFAQIVNRKRLLKTVLLKIESNSFIAKIARKEVFIVLTKHVKKIPIYRDFLLYNNLLTLTNQSSILIIS